MKVIRHKAITKCISYWRNKIPVSLEKEAVVLIIEKQLFTPNSPVVNMINTTGY
jgi:hypothetical protein